MSSSVITPALLDALLSAGPHRAEAENAFKSASLVDRASGLLSALLRGGGNDAAAHARSTLAAVLLRRDISSLGGAAAGLPSTDNAASSSSSSPAACQDLLQSMSGPMLSLFLDPSKCGSENVRRQVGHCVSELCLSLSLASSADGDGAMGAALNGIGQGCASADVPSLRLLSDLAERSPHSLWRASGTNSDALMSLLQSSVTALSSGGGMDKVDAVLEAVVNVAIASQVAIKSAAARSTTGGENNELLLAMKAQTEEASAAEHSSSVPVDPKSPASKLGKTCLPPLLTMLAPSRGVDPDVRGGVARKLSHAATRCPSLVAGDIGVLGCLIKTCLVLARAGGADAEDEEEANACLAALEVLASAVEVDDVRKRVVLTASMTAAGMENLLQLLLVGEDGQRGGAIRLCSEYIVSGTDDDLEGWSADPASLAHDSTSSWDGDDVSTFAESLLESFLRHLGGGAQTLPVVLPLVEQLMQSPPDQWRNHRAALSMLERCLDAAPVAFAPHVHVAVETALQSSSHPCPRVQYQAIQLLGALCHADSVSPDGQVQIRRGYAPRILQSLASAAGPGCTKVSAHASLALVSYCRGGDGKPDCGRCVDKELLVPYLADVLGALSSGPLSVDVTNPAAVGAGGVAVLVRAISAVACLADASGDEFAPHYASIMPGLLGCAKFGLEFDQAGGVRVAPNAGGHDFAQLRGSAIESATIVGQAVGSENPEAFVPDAESIMGIILPLLNLAESGGDASAIIPLDQLLAASARIASIMGERYSPFLPSVLPHLLRRAREEAEVSVLEGDEAGLAATKSGLHQIDEDAGTESVTVQLPGVGLKKLVLNTTQMQEKSQSARAVYEHARSMGAAFGPHAETTLGAFLPLIEFKYSAEVRGTAAQACGPVFDALCQYATQEKGASHLPGQALPALAKAVARQIQLEDADDQETVFALADSLSEVFYSAYRRKDARGEPIAVLGAADSRTVVSQAVEIAKACLERRSYLLSTMSGADGVVPDADELALLEDQLQSESEQLSELVNAIGYNIKSLKESFSPIFDQIVAPFFGRFLPASYAASPAADVRARVAAVCLFDDVVEHCGTTMAAKYAAMLAEAVALGVDDATNMGDDDLKSASVYGVAQLARNGPEGALDGAVHSVLMRLVQIVQAEAGRPKEDMDNAYLVECAASAVASLAVLGNSPYRSANLPVDRATLMNLYLSVLPMTEDPDEARVCHSGLCDLIDSRTIDPTTPGVPALVARILALAEGDEHEDIATPATCSRLAGILKGVQEVSGAAAVRGVLANMTVEERNAVTKAMERATPNSPGSGRGSSPISVARMR